MFSVFSVWCLLCVFLCVVMCCVCGVVWRVGSGLSVYESVHSGVACLVSALLFKGKRLLAVALSANTKCKNLSIFVLLDSLRQCKHKL